MRFRAHHIGLMLADALLSAASYYLAYSLRMAAFPLASADSLIYFESVGPLLLLRVAALHVLGVYRISARYTGLRDLKVLTAATLASSMAFALYAFPVYGDDFRRRVVVIDWFINLYCIAGMRVAYRMFIDERVSRPAGGNGRANRRILIIGAGARGATLAREIRRRPFEGLQLVGFLDDDPAKKGLLVHGASVLGSTENIRTVVEDRQIDDVIIAMTAAPGKVVRGISVRCENLPVRLKISPGFSELNDEDQLRTLRDVSLEDLLRRKPAEVNTEEIAAYLRGERVLITGAGGSIGAELVRQIAAVRPAEILLLGHGENSVFEIEQEMRREYGLTPQCLIADTRDYDRVERLFRLHRPTVVFHAAAHKHVPLMESNPEEAVTTNVQGTRNLARIATATGVRRFVMISTDKAVRPTSVMGVTKRVAELVVQAESLRSTTEFATVRFGNVLGSRGSVVPTLRKQIARGGPVTVTHPDAVRYFMTIPEAVQLTVQAGAMGGHGTIYILDMGEPVRIMDLARDVIRLSGLVPDKDIRIEITGLRPGERLFEELLTAEEGASVTRHERIFAARPGRFSVPDLDRNVDDLIDAANAGMPAEVLRLLARIEPTYRRPDAQAVIPVLPKTAAVATQRLPAGTRPPAVEPARTPV